MFRPLNSQESVYCKHDKLGLNLAYLICNAAKNGVRTLTGRKEGPAKNLMWFQFSRNYVVVAHSLVLVHQQKKYNYWMGHFIVL